jgi:hypothetical protein
MVCEEGALELDCVCNQIDLSTSTKEFCNLLFSNVLVM